MRIIKTYPYTPVLKISAFYTAFEAVREVGFFFNGESHDSWECVFVLEGRAGVSSGEHIYILGPGQVIIHPPCEFHRIWNEGDIGLRIVIISFCTEHFPLTQHGVYNFPSEEQLLKVLKRIQFVYTRNASGQVTLSRDDVSPAETQLAVSELENYFIKLLCHGEEVVSPERDKRSAIYAKALETMRENLPCRFTAQEIADRCGVSVSTLQKLFQRFTGMGMIKYYEGMVMEHAHEMIEDGKRIKEVAIDLGYRDQNYFSTAYKRYFGMSPTKYSKD